MPLSNTNRNVSDGGGNTTSNGQSFVDKIKNALSNLVGNNTPNTESQPKKRPQNQPQSQPQQRNTQQQGRAQIDTTQTEQKKSGFFDFLGNLFKKDKSANRGNSASSTAQTDIRQSNTPSNRNDSIQSSFAPTEQNNVTQPEVKTRNDFTNDGDYEDYLFNNRIDMTKGDAFNYLKEKASNEGMVPRAYMEQMRTNYKNRKDVADVRQKIDEGAIDAKWADDINGRFNAVLDENGNEVDANKYQTDIELVNTTADDINKKIEKLNKDYSEGKIDYNTMSNEYNRLRGMWDENMANGERLNSYQTLSGFDYYDWAKENGKDVTDFEAYVENFNDSIPERLAQEYVASWYDTARIVPETIELAKTVFDPNYNFTDENSTSSQMKQTADELRSYALGGANQAETWSLQCVGSLMPMINSMMVGSLLPVNAETFTNVSLGLQSGAETTRQRLAEGNDVATSVINGALHGTITALVEALNAGAITDLLTGGAEKYIVSMGLFSKATPSAIAGYLGSMAVSEGAEETIETLADWFADQAQNMIIGNLSGQTVDVTELNPADMANEFIMASVGTVLLGAPNIAGITIDSKQKYNAMLSAREHFNSVIADENALPQEKELASRALEVVNYGLGEYEENTAVPGVELPSDQVAPAMTYDELMNSLVNAIQPDVKANLESAMQTYEHAENVRDTLQRTLVERGMNIDAGAFADMSPQQREQYMNITKELNNSGVRNIATRLGRGQNGFNVNGGIAINTDQSTSLDVEALADLDDNVAKKAIATGGDEIFMEAGADASATATASHELTHYAEQSGKWNDLRDTVESMMGSDRYEKAKSRIEQIYKARGIEDVNAEHELVAFYIQNNFGNTEFLRRLSSYNSSLFNRLFSKARAMFSKDSLVKLEDTFMGAIYESQRKLETQGTPAYSIGSVFQAVNITLEKVGNRFEAYVDGKKVDKVTLKDVKSSPLGNLMDLSVRKGFLTRTQASDQMQMYADTCNLILNTGDADLVWAVSGSLGYQQAPEGVIDETKKTKSSAFTTNADKQYTRTFDVTTICNKTQQVINVMSEAMMKLGRGLTEDEIVKVVYDEVNKAGEPVPCPVCYVFSRWVGVGGLLDNIKRYQIEYADANVEELRKRYNTLSKQVDAIAKKEKIKGTDARDVVDKQLNEEYNHLLSKQNVEKLTGKKMSEKDVARMAELKEDIAIMDRWSWIGKVRLSDNYQPVPDKVLFDMNKGEVFANDYPETWTYRTTRGPAMGKAITPYTSEVLGQTIYGFSTSSSQSMKKLGEKRSDKTNTFLKEDGTKTRDNTYNKAINNARRQNLIGGSRAQSTSDFRFEYVLDYMLHFMELQSINSYGQTYTKVPEAVPLLASVGYETNMSLMAKGTGFKEVAPNTENAFECTWDSKQMEKGKWYTLEFSNVTGMNASYAFKLAQMYDTAQPIIVGINDDHMRMCMNDPRITFIIPYHASGASEQRYLDLMKSVGEEVLPDARRDYSKVQEDALIDKPTPEQKKLRKARLDIIMGNATKETRKAIEGNEILENLYDRFYKKGVDSECYQNFLKKDQAEKIFPYEYWDKTTTIETADVNGQRFVQYCNDLGMVPRFEQFSGESGYWKMLIDRPMYNVDGSYHYQRAINLDNFNTDYLQKGKVIEGIIQPQVSDLRETAIQMYEQGIPENEIWQETGWVRTENGEWLLQPSKMFNNQKTAGITEKALGRIENGQYSLGERGTIQYSAGGAMAINNLINSSDPDLKWRGMDLFQKSIEAQEMEAEGVSPTDIWYKTGWIRKKDGKWRFQFYDGAEDTIAKIGDNLKEIGRVGLSSFISNHPFITLEDVVGKDNVLFDMYPELRNTQVNFSNNQDKKTTTGYFSKEGNQIVLNVAEFGNWSDFWDEYEFSFDEDAVEEISNTFFHELQHAIQELEGFESGSNLAIAERDLVTDYTTKTEKKLNKLIQKYKKNSAPGTVEFKTALASYIAELNSGGDPANIKRMVTSEQFKTIENFYKVYKKAGNLNLKDDEIFGRYYSNLGEIEAREEGKRGVIGLWRLSPPGPYGTLKNKTSKNDIKLQFSLGEGASNQEILHKQRQNEIIQRTNPRDPRLGSHTWIDSADDIMTFPEAVADFYPDFETMGDDEELTPDYTIGDARKAMESGKITVYSSYPIENGIFVTPSKMEAQNYAGDGKVYKKTVSLNDVAWIDAFQGQYAKVDSNAQYALGEGSGNYGYHYGAEKLDPNYKSERLWKRGGRGTGAFGTGTYFLGNQAGGSPETEVFGKGKSEHKVDFSKYNLFKPKNYIDGINLHDIFRDLDNAYRYANENSLDEYLSDLENVRNDMLAFVGEEKKDKNAPELDLDGIDLDSDDWFEEFTVRELLYEQELREYEENKGDNPYDLLRPEDDEYKHFFNTLVNAGMPYDEARQLFQKNENDDGAVNLRDVAGDIANYYLNHEDLHSESSVPWSIYGRKKYSKVMQKVERLSEILGVDTDNLYDTVRSAMLQSEMETHNSDFYDGNYDSVGTKIMKALGYDGIDVRNIQGLDDTAYGSVIYDLKPETIQYALGKKGSKSDTKQLSPEQAQDNVLETSVDELPITKRTDGKNLKNNGVAKVLKETPDPKTAESKFKRMWRIAKHEIVDHLDAVRELSRKYKNKKINAFADYAMLAPNMAGETIANKRYKLRTNKVIGESLNDIMGNLTEDQKQILGEYVYNWRNIDHLTIKDRTGGENKKGVFGDSYGVDDSVARIAEIEEANPWVKNTAERLWKFCALNRQMLVDGGIISKKMSDKLAKETPHYVPIQRNTDGSSDVKAIDPNKALKKYKGSDIDILPLEATLIKHTQNVYQSVLQNSLHNEIINTLGNAEGFDADAIDDVIDQGGFNPLEADTRGKRMFAYRDGKKVSIPIDDDLYNSLTPRKNPWGLPDLTPVQKITEFRRNLITGWNPLFSLSNMAKDFQDALFNTKYPTKFLGSLAEAWAQIATNGEFKQLYMANGGGQNAYINELGSAKTKGKNVFGKALNTVVKINEAIELAPRLAEFIASLKDGTTIEEAMYNASEVTTNFKRGGDTAKYINRNGFAFFNASIQGFDKQLRNIQDAKDGGVKGILTYMAKATLLGGLPLYLLNHLLWKDDDDYEELSDYAKENYYCVKKYGDGKFIRIPKGRVASFYQTVMQNGIDTLQGKVKLWEALLDDYESFMDNVAPNNPGDNFIGRPLIDAYRNKTWYGKDLVPTRLQDLPDSEQYDSSTDALSIAIGRLSKLVADKTGMSILELSPYKVNYVLDQYSGAIGDILLPMMSQKTDVEIDNPILKGIASPWLDRFTTDAVLKNRNVTEFYSLKDEVTKLAKSNNATDEQILANKYMNSVSSAMGKLYSLQRDIQSDPNLSNKEKYTQVREIQRQINELAKAGLANYDQFDVNEDTATVGGIYYYKDDDGEWKKSNSSNESVRQTIEIINNSNVSAQAKNAMFDSFYDGKLTNHINAMGLSDEDALALKMAGKMAQGKKDANGKTISNSKAEATAQAYDELGLLDDVLQYIKDNEIEPSEMGLSKTVYNRLIGGSYSSYRSKKKSSKKSSRRSGGGRSSGSKRKSTSKGLSAGGGTVSYGKGRVTTARSGQVASPSNFKQARITNDKFLNAYSSSIGGGGRKNVSTGGSGGQVVCPRCGNRVSNASGTCPVCGARL